MTFFKFSPDTDVLVLVIANYKLMLKNTFISMASGVMRLEPIWRSIGAERAKALPAFHALTDAVNTGKFKVWGQASIALQDHQLDLLQNGYYKESDGQWKPTMTDALPAPHALAEYDLFCTDLCQCSSECQNVEDTQNMYKTDDNDDGHDM